VKHLTTPDLDVRIALGRVRDEVIKDTNSQQEPYVYGSLGGDQIMLARSTPAEASEATAAAAPAATTPAPAASSLDGDAWRDYELAARLNTIPVWDEFLKTHSTGFIGNLARGQRAKLLAEPPPAAAPAPAAVAAIPPETKTRTLSHEEPSSRRERRREAVSVEVVAATARRAAAPPSEPCGPRWRSGSTIGMASSPPSTRNADDKSFACGISHGLSHCIMIELWPAQVQACAGHRRL
jgi:pyruvate/2-oxoglutarate dehydrogenase complex dihydrolipoamide acyltransferase (E2) component